MLTGCVEPAVQFAFNVIGKVLLSLDPGSMTEEYAREFDAMREGFKAFPYAIPGTAFSRALKVLYCSDAQFFVQLL